MCSINKRIAVSAASMLIAMWMIQTATAGEHAAKHRGGVTASEQIRSANAAAPFQVDQDELAQLRNGAGSAPAGR
jgi:hypothetical protein